MAKKNTANPKSYAEVWWSFHYRGFYPYQRSRRYWVTFTILILMYFVTAFSYYLRNPYGSLSLTYYVSFMVPIILMQAIDYYFYRTSKH